MTGSSWTPTTYQPQRLIPIGSQVSGTLSDDSDLDRLVETDHTDLA